MHPSTTSLSLETIFHFKTTITCQYTVRKPHPVVVHEGTLWLYPFIRVMLAQVFHM